MSSAYACFVCGNFTVEDSPQSIGNYSHFITQIGHHPPPLNPNLPPDTETDPDPHEIASLDVRLHKYVGSRGANYFSDAYSPDDTVYAAGSGRIHVTNDSPRLELFTTHLNNLPPPQHHLQIEAEDYCTATFVFVGQCIEHLPDRVFVLRTGSYDPQVR